ncbi:acyl carrier protein [Streptomyces morookaense]|uniref:acyl carrier protein n=1 Tax=Streptomyces morookaense TaxID=1970 RepID=UPI0033DECC79
MNSVQDRLVALLGRLEVPTEDLSADATFDSLDFDSLALIELSVAVQKEFGVVVDETELSPESTVADVIGLLQARTAVA